MFQLRGASVNSNNVQAERQIKRETEQIIYGDNFLDSIMDTPEDKEKVKLIKSFSGIIDTKNGEIFYHTVFAEKHGKFTPVVVTNEGKIYAVKYQAIELLELSQDEDEPDLKDDKEKPIYSKLSDVPSDEHYFFFERKGVRYKYSKKVKWTNSQINTIDNDAIRDVIDLKPYDKKIFMDLVEIIKEYYYHSNHYEYDILATAAIITYIKNCLGNVFYLIFFGFMGTGKSTGLVLLSFLQFRGFFTGKGTVASSCRLIHTHSIDLNQDEFEKMDKKEKTQFVNIMNNGFNSYGKYTLTDTNRKDIYDQGISLDTFGMKAFTCNDLDGFHPSFIDRCHVIRAVKRNKHLKNIYKLSKEELHRFQDMRNKLFVYCVFNWKKIIENIKQMEQVLEEQNLFGRETDKNSIILGIIQHFKGSDYEKAVEQYLSEKAPVHQLERYITIETVILETIVIKIGVDTNRFIDVENEELYQAILMKLNLSPNDRYAPSNTKPRRILDSLGLIPKKENLGFVHGGRRIYHINIYELVHCLKSNNYTQLLKKVPNRFSVTTVNTLTTVTKNGEGIEGNEDSEGRIVKHEIIDYVKNRDDVTYDEFCIAFKQDIADLLLRQGILVRLPNGRIILGDVINE